MLGVKMMKLLPRNTTHLGRGGGWFFNNIKSAPAFLVFSFVEYSLTKKIKSIFNT
jgi:hypothetical protein